MLPLVAPRRRARAGVPRPTTRSAIDPATRSAVDPTTRATVAVGVVLVLVLVGGCRSAPTPSAAAFCRRIEANRAALTGPVIDAASTTQILAAYRTVGAVAPVAVRDAWTTVTALLESATSVDLTQAKATEALAARALAAKPEIDRIVDYTRTTCNIEIGAALPVAPATPAPTGVDPAGVDPAVGTTTEAAGTIPATVAPRQP